MPLTPESAARKDKTNAHGAVLEHRHFAFIAGVFLAERPSVSAFEKRREWDHLVCAFADACAASNPRFNRTRFYAACGRT